MDSINPLAPPSLVGSATSQGRGWNSQNQQQPALGQLFKALVVEAREGRRFILDIGGNRLTASSTATLSQDQALQLQAVKTEPIIELKIVNDNTPTPFAGRSLTLLGKTIDLFSLLQTVRRLDPSAPVSLNPFSRGVFERFSDLGNLRIDFRQNTGGLFIKFATDSKEKADFWVAFGDELKDSITAAPLIGLTFSGGAPDPINDLIRRLMPEGRSMLDTKV